MNINQELVNKIKSNTHHQFELSKVTGEVVCKCGRPAVYFRDGYLCGTITAYPCKYNKQPEQTNSFIVQDEMVRVSEVLEWIEANVVMNYGDYNELKQFLTSKKK